MNKKTKIALGMSGGVDSSLCAHLLVEQGYQVTGVFLECWRAPGCRTDEDRADALKIALALGIPFQVLDFKTAYYDKVVAEFFAQYKAGITPNPDIACNKEIKFGLFYDWALANGFDAVATGHYAAIRNKQLVIPKDTNKDQTYFLHQLASEQLEHMIFPLADLTKPEVRLEAKKRDLAVCDKKDSVGICFIGDINVHAFLKEELGENPGEVIDTQGNVIGSHQGLWFYTIGQRHGFTVDKKSLHTSANGEVLEKENLPPFYVVAKQPEGNKLVVGFGKETYSNSFIVKEPHWIDPSQTALQTPSGKLFVRIRHTGKLLACSVSEIANGIQVSLAEPVQGIAPGQSAVFYQQTTTDTICLGGGVISPFDA
ncbi:MAG: tRNA 2-thiouridine(34) synthase MnmA [Candidatus Pacebacteria bacterium CG10_big_fil_rev_8_21_14_0_10_45_6]|nr:MAG: tRNA 2-thiouridine(34) synthase MnmA [Candidatus Pacebacteria bacterium CG10_big_fil_rev_8_21_14_0_10_45_6]